MLQWCLPLGYRAKGTISTWKLKSGIVYSATFCLRPMASFSYTGSHESRSGLHFIFTFYLLVGLKAGFLADPVMVHAQAIKTF